MLKRYVLLVCLLQVVSVIAFDQEPALEPVGRTISVAAARVLEGHVDEDQIVPMGQAYDVLLQQYRQGPRVPRASFAIPSRARCSKAPHLHGSRSNKRAE